ncbi:MAG TPA: hypothetical protein VII94_05670, partial [Candidatus Saccharimonadales bacterium]
MNKKELTITITTKDPLDPIVFPNMPHKLPANKGVYMVNGNARADEYSKGKKFSQLEITQEEKDAAIMQARSELSPYDELGIDDGGYHGINWYRAKAKEERDRIRKERKPATHISLLFQDLVMDDIIQWMVDGKTNHQTYRLIRENYNISPYWVKALYKKSQDKLKDLDDADTLKQRTLVLRQLQALYGKAITSKDNKLALEVLEKKIKMFGLNEPSKLELSMKPIQDMSDTEIEKLLGDKS